MRIDRFDYDLPEPAIAQEPLDRRDASRLLVDAPAGIEHGHVSDLPRLVGPGDVVVVNDTRVRPARLHLRKETGGAVEVLLLEPLGDQWVALVRPSRRVAPGTVLRPHESPSPLQVVAGDERGDGTRLVRLEVDGSLDDALARHGEMPLPPYIGRRLADPERYQTVFAREPGSAAAPTAGLHFTPALLDRCREAGAVVATVELKVGLDTFRPVTVDDLDDHRMHTETYRVPGQTWQACLAADRVLAVGTTTVRALESAARGARTGRTDLFIRPGFEFRVVDRLLTNFHLPRSTLLVMIEAFMGPRWRDLYALALAEGYRFLSFGDAMLVDRAPVESLPSEG
ncbi:MAG: tRNA preQ1(34) S-adenosylmethionine ribosyltransferase-isomerase QueA [Acidimicrobiia bacterium]|nr:tRNA preQ1(34) S-adenosylmethionine ribosyltransferase-isomerase QueA [Acidimicrobiia bacterium]